jgi:hypothetical protein
VRISVSVEVEDNCADGVTWCARADGIRVLFVVGYAET